MAESFGYKTRRSGLTASPTSARRSKLPLRASLRACRLATLSAPPRARAPPPPRPPSALASPPPAGARAPLSTAAHTAPRPAPTAGTHTSRYQALSCLSARLARARAAPRDLQRPRLTPSSGARVPSLLRSPTLGPLLHLHACSVYACSHPPVPRRRARPVTSRPALCSQPLSSMPRFAPNPAEPLDAVALQRRLLSGQENILKGQDTISARLQALESGAAGSSQQQATLQASLNAQRGEVRSAALLARPRSPTPQPVCASGTPLSGP